MKTVMASTAGLAAQTPIAEAPASQPVAIVQTVQRDPGESLEVFTARIHALEPTRIDLASAVYADYDPKTGRLPITLELED
jgi:hypothetical protein